MPGLTVTREIPLGRDLDLIFDRHHQHCHADTPPESIHMLDRAALVSPDIAFYVLREDGRAIGIGAVKTLSPGEGEIKSMHLLSEARGGGRAAFLITHLIEAARATGLTRLSLETGAQDSFAAARAAYVRAGFAECPPFGDYRPDPNSVFMTRNL